MSEFQETSWARKELNHCFFFGFFTYTGTVKLANPNDLSLLAVFFSKLPKPFIDVVVAPSVANNKQLFVGKKRIDEGSIIVSERFRVMNQLGRLAKAGDYGRCGDVLPRGILVSDTSEFNRREC